MEPALIHHDLLSGALLHLGRALSEDCPRSSAIAALLFGNLGENAALDEPLRQACRELADTLDTLGDNPGQRT